MPSTRLLYGTTAFLSAFLLFLIEPLAAKQLLPVLGGSSAVWLTCLVFFQTTLLLGYLYAHWLTSDREAGTPLPATDSYRRHRVLALVALCLRHRLRRHEQTAQTTPSSPSSGPSPAPSAFPFSSSLPPALSCSSGSRSAKPTSDGKPAPVWYRLFALSNTGSLLALFAYPTLIEPHLTLKTQRILWSAGFILLSLLLCILTANHEPTPRHPQPQRRRPTRSSHHRWLWFLLPMAAAMQLAAVTAHITINIAAIPLLWILPLAIYLLTFILAFDRPAFYRRGFVVRILVVMLASLGYALSKTDFSLPILLTIGFFLFECFVACLFCHAETYALRPQRASETTLFYLLIAAGGATGTFLVAIAFPLLFSPTTTSPSPSSPLPCSRFAATWSDGWPQRVFSGRRPASSSSSSPSRCTAPMRSRPSLQVRNFYGTLRVTQTDAPECTPHANPAPRSHPARHPDL